MTLEPLKCYRCGATLAELTLPLSRLDQCPSCQVDLHVCRMCVNYDPSVTESCTEDDAFEVKDKRKANFCDFFKPNRDAYDPAEIGASRKAREQLAALFGGDEGGCRASDEGSAPQRAADALFKK
jgi:hypothetical protein